MKTNKNLIILAVITSLLTGITVNAEELTDYSGIKDALFLSGHEVSFSVNLSGLTADIATSGYSGTIKNSEVYHGNQKENIEYIEFTTVESDIEDNRQLKCIRKYQIFNRTMQKNGNSYDVKIEEIITADNEKKSGNVIRNRRFYLTIGKNITFFDRTVISAGDSYNPSDMELFLKWFEGEFDNYKQHREDKKKNIKNPHEHIHSIIMPVEMKNIDGHTFYIQQYFGGNPGNIYRQRIYSIHWDSRVRKIITRVYKFKENPGKYAEVPKNPSILENIELSEISYIKGCDVVWERNGNKFYGKIEGNNCTLISSGSGKKLSISENLVLSRDAFWILETTVNEKGEVIYGRKDGIYNKLQRCSFYRGNVKIRKSDGKYATVENIVLHDRGDKIVLENPDTGKNEYGIKIAHNGGEDGEEFLELGIYREDEDTTLIKAGSGTDKIGASLGWIEILLNKTNKEFKY